jgi:hypothetical protein
MERCDKYVPGLIYLSVYTLLILRIYLENNIQDSTLNDACQQNNIAVTNNNVTKNNKV